MRVGSRFQEPEKPDGPTLIRDQQTINRRKGRHMRQANEQAKKGRGAKFCIAQLLWSMRIAFLLTTVSFATASVASAAEPAELFRKATPGSAVVVDHSSWDRLLKAYVSRGKDGVNRVDYSAFKRSGQGDLKRYIESLQRTDPGKLNKAEQFAFLANLYNATTIDVVLDNYPVKSIKDISLGGGLLATFTGGPWKAKVVTLRGEKLSLDDIEHGILRPVFRDPRVHYAVNCASVGCPNLRTEAFTGAKLDAQLDDAAREYINHPRGVTVHENQLIVSSIYTWFKADFGGSDIKVIAHLRRFAGPDLSGKLARRSSIDDYRYDWAINDLLR